MKHFSKTILVFYIVLIFNCTKSSLDQSISATETKDAVISATEIYGTVPMINYLRGDFSRDKNLKTFTNPIEKNSHTLREDTIFALQKMIKAYDIDRESKSKQHIFVVSAHRNFIDQKMIWENKFTGKKKMRESIEGKSKEEIIDLILEFSSAPSTSRHHWGTDMDLNALQNQYFETGNGKFLYEWMQKNAHLYGFCQPYNEHNKRGFKGYKEEKWHWSYAPVANILVKDWEKSFKDKQITFNGKFLGSDLLGEKPLEYVTNINSDCIKINKAVK
jgi:zinc D-Ala-D-Ala carboxypeptidase